MINDRSNLTESNPLQPQKPRLGLFLWRAANLKCPECGISPLFLPVRQTRSFHAWLTPLRGCSNCNFDYEREQGYFLLATWGSQYFVVAGFGLVLGFVLLALLKNMWLAIALTALPTVVLGFLFARHAKAFYLAVDHYYDPQAKRK